MAREAGVAHLSEIIKGTKPINWKVLKAISDNPTLGRKAVGFVLSGSAKDPDFSLANFNAGVSDCEGKIAIDAKLDVELLGDIIWTIEEYLESQDRVLDANLKARAIGLLYLHFLENKREVRKSKDTIESYLKLVV